MTLLGEYGGIYQFNCAPTVPIALSKVFPGWCVRFWVTFTVGQSI